MFNAAAIGNQSGSLSNIILMIQSITIPAQAGMAAIRHVDVVSIKLGLRIIIDPSRSRPLTSLLAGTTYQPQRIQSNNDKEFFSL